MDDALTAEREMMFVNMEGVYFLARLLYDIQISYVADDHILFVCFMHDNKRIAYCGKLVNKLNIELAFCDVEEIVEDEITRECLDELCVGWAV